MDKKFTQTAIGDVKDRILAGDFNYYYGGSGSDLDDERYYPDNYDGEDDDEEEEFDDVDYDFIDVEDYDKYYRLYDEYYLAESQNKKYNILDASRMATLLDTDAPFIRKIDKSGLVVIGNEHSQDAIDFRNTKPNYLYDLENLNYPMGYDWFVVNRISPNTLLMSNNDSFVLFDIKNRDVISKPYDTVQRLIDNVFVSSVTVDDKLVYELLDVTNKHLMNLSEICSLDSLIKVEVSSETEFNIVDDKGEKYEIKLDENRNYRINKV